MIPQREVAKVVASGAWIAGVPPARRFASATVLAMLTVALVACSGSKTTTPAPLKGSLTVLVSRPDRTNDVTPVGEPGALPVQSSGTMCIDAELDEPAFLYLLWLDAQGQVLPLYPWNNETLEVTDIGQPPPVRRATKRIFSPLLGRSWSFGDREGRETVILLARRTALPAEISIAQLLQGSAPAVLRDEQDLVQVQLPAGGASSAKKNANESSGVELRAFLDPLAKHFELVSAVQFAHAEKSAK